MPSLNTSRPVDTLLTEIAVEFSNDADEYLASKVCPVVPVDEESGTFFKFTLESFFGDTNESGDNLRRAPQAEYLRGGWDLTTGTYKCAEYGYEDAIDQRIAMGLDKYFDVEARCVKSATEKVLIGWERRCATLLQTAGNWSSTEAAGGDWDNGGTPVDDIDSLQNKILLAGGRRPNTIVMGFGIWQAMRKNSQVTSLFGDNERKAITIQEMGTVFSAMFGIDNILVSSAVYNSAALGQSASLAEVWSNTDNVWVGFVNQDASKIDPSASYTFAFEDIAAFSYDEDAIRSSIVRVNHTTSEQVVAAQLGGTITDVLA